GGGGYGRKHGPFPADAAVLERSEILHRDDARGMNSMRAPADRAPFRPTDNRIRLTPSNQSRRAQGGPPWLTKPFLVANFCLEPALPARRLRPARAPSRPPPSQRSTRRRPPCPPTSRPSSSR